MIKQGVEINTWGKNVYVKVPVVNSKNQFTGPVIRHLNNRNIKLNITAVYSAKQTARILKVINKKTRVIISIFAGRAGDTGKDPVPMYKSKNIIIIQFQSLSKVLKFQNVLKIIF